MGRLSCSMQQNLTLYVYAQRSPHFAGVFCIYLNMNLLAKAADWLGYEKSAGDSGAVVQSNNWASAPEWGSDEVLKAYETNEWVFAAVGVIAQETAGIRLTLLETTGKGKNKKVTEVTEHPVLDLIRRPNSAHTGFEIRETTQMHQELTGSSYLAINRDGANRPRELWPLDPSKMKLKMRSTGEVERYEYRLGASIRIFQPDDIIHFRFSSPRHLHYGTGPTQAAALSIDTDTFAAKWNRNWFFNSAIPAFLMFLENTFNKEAQKNFARSWRKKHQGIENSHKFQIIDSAKGAKFFDLSKSQKDMDFVQQGYALRDKILSAYRVPKALLGQSADVNRASMEASIYSFAKYTIKPRIRRFAEKLTIELLRQYPHSQNLHFSFEDPVPQDAEALLARRENGLKNGWMTINEARAEEGLPPVEGGDVPLVGFNQVPLDQTTITDSAPSSSDSKSLETKGADVRDRLKTKFLKRHSRHEKRFESLMQTLFTKQEQKVLQKIRQDGKKMLTKEVDPGEVLDREREVATFVVEATAVYELAVEDGGTQAAALVGAAGKFDFDDPDVRLALSRMTMKFAKTVNDTTINALKDQLAAGLASGESIDELAKRVKTVFKEAKTSRAIAIARTETTKAMNGGSMISYKQSGVKQVEWLATEDMKTRPAHAAADGQTVKTGDLFSVGGELVAGPGEGDIAENNINCRCTVLPK